MKDLGEQEIMLSRILQINSPMGPGDEMIVPGDLQGSSNVVTVIYGLLMVSHRDPCVIIEVELQ